VIDQGQSERAARAVTGAPVDGRIEARIRVAVGDVDNAPFARACADQAGAQRDADVLHVAGDLEHELLRLGIVQPH